MNHLFGRSVHTAFVVPELEPVIDRMVSSGHGPVFTLNRILGLGRYRGQRSEMVTNVAFIEIGGVHYEYVEQIDDSPSIYREFLERHPMGGMHHIAYYSSDFAADMERAKQLGHAMDIVQEFALADGTRFEVYLEPQGRPDAVLTQLMYPGVNETIFSRMAEMSANWDGSQRKLDLFELLPPEIDLPRAN